MTDRRQVRLMSDYGVRWPLWDSTGAMDPSAFDVSERLAARLLAWQQHFEQRFHHERGWRSAQDSVAYAEEGKELQRLLMIDIGTWAYVELDLWPVAAGGDRGSPA